MSIDRSEQYTSEVVAGPGGVMTDEVGVITGNLTLTTALRTDSRADIHVQYTGADESYTLTGSPVPVAPGGLHGLHVRVVEAVRRGGQAVVPGA